MTQKQRIYFDNAATTPLLPEVIAVITEVYQKNFGNPSSIHAEGRAARAALEKCRRSIAGNIGAQAAELFFTSGGTEANNTALKGAVLDLGVQRIISSPIEHPCVRNILTVLEQEQAIELLELPLHSSGVANLKALAELLQQSQQKTLVSLMHSNNEVGCLNDLEAIGELCRTHSALFHSDTVQTLGYYPINLKELPIDFVSGSAHKLHGPKGVGFLYINQQHKIRPLIYGGGQERQLRSGTENLAGIAGFSKALELAVEQMETNRTKITGLREAFKAGLQARFGEQISFNGDVEQGHYKVLSVNFDTATASDMLLFKLDLAGIAVSGGSACSSGALKGSAVLSALKVPENLKTIRFSFSHLNTEAEVSHCLSSLQEIIG